ncbi:MAG: site-specific integrase [Nitrospirae bacterium]|nr:site-specific integrase [Nitrospirota bacterium]
MTRGVYKRGAIYWIRYAGIDGRTRYESTGGTNFKDAVNLLTERKKSVQDGIQPETKRIANYSFMELADKYIEWMTGRQKSARTKGYIIGELKQVFGSLPLRRFNTLIVEQLQTDLMVRGLKPASVNKILNVLKAMFSKAIEWEMIELETSKRVHKVENLKGEGKRIRFLTVEECRLLIDSCDERLKPIIIIAVNTGMRKGEILSLKWDNVDIKHGFIMLDVTKNGERREVPLNDTLKNVLHGITRRLDVAYVFHDNITGKPYKEVKRSFASACKKAGIKDFRFHDLRHTFASHLVMSGVDLTTVSKLMGHKSLTMTLRYSHLAQSHINKAVNILDLTLTSRSTIQKLYNSGSD